MPMVEWFQGTRHSLDTSQRNINHRLGPAVTLCEVLRKPGLPDGLFSKQKITIWVNFGRSSKGRLWAFGLFYGYLVILWLLWSFGIFFTVLVCCIKKNLATLSQTGSSK
jgi:hypothetical protein